ncbi:hypothetical protein psyc5s11_14050 [Clostridium gelidum]|uniref:Polyketide cyclase n=1 Tax=Clostridium gelidum TaxID=704125 RepID=A0ABM7T2G0_9CLOT|nr:SRPBCC family protein [Clostridium gelidum]BCZ45338.1 hypothetical protein psyc5s11_14050 [Clostridium gelidum]
MSKARKSEITATFKTDIKIVWDVVTNNNDYKWRSDIERIEIIDNGNTFIEYTPNGISTKFTITKKNLYNRYEFNLENKNFTGSWVGDFSEIEKGGTKIVFTENIFIKNPIIRVLSYLFMDLKKIQNNYILDLKRKLGEE